jgi:type IV pilus assembly protein PilP
MTLILSLAACKKEGTPGQQPGQTTAAAPKVAKPLQKKLSSAQPPLPPPPLNFSKKKDPFRPFISPATATKSATVTTKAYKKRSELPIHSYDVSQFKVIGIITGLRENRAMIVDPTGKSYVIKVGMTVGLNEGRVTRINPASVEITEQFSDDSGKKRKQLVKLNLPRIQEKIK